MNNCYLLVAKRALRLSSTTIIWPT